MNRRDATRLVSIALSALLAAAAFAGCAKDEKKDDAPDYSITFAADGPPAAGEIALAASTEGDRLVLDVVAGGGFSADAYALAFRLTYDRDVMKYAGTVEAGDALASDGVELLAAAAQNGKNELVVGVSRSNTFDGVALAEGGVLLRLTFKPVGAGTTRVDFVETGRRLAGDRLDAIDVAAWKGGTATVKD
jgi:hypothetical protein